MAIEFSFSPAGYTSFSRSWQLRMFKNAQNAYEITALSSYEGPGGTGGAIGTWFYGEASAYSSECNIDMFINPMSCSLWPWGGLLNAASVSTALADFAAAGFSATKTVRHYTGSHQSYTEEVEPWSQSISLGLVGIDWDVTGPHYTLLSGGGNNNSVSNGYVHEFDITETIKAYFSAGRHHAAVMWFPFSSEFTLQANAVVDEAFLMALWSSTYSNTVPGGMTQPNIVGDVTVMNISWNSITCYGGVLQCNPDNIALVSDARPLYGRVAAGAEFR